MSEYDRRARALAAERLRPDHKPPGVGEQLVELIAALRRLYTTPPDHQGDR